MTHRAAQYPSSAQYPDDFPDGTRYVVEGRNTARGSLRVSARYVVYPDGRRIDLPLRAVQAPPLAPAAPMAEPRRKPAHRGRARALA